MDILSQAKSGMEKNAVFVLATLQQIELVDGQVPVLVMCHTRELAFQISKEDERFSKFLPAIKKVDQNSAKNGIFPNSGVKIICQDNSGVKITCLCDQNMAKNGVFPNSGAKIICLETI